MPPTASPPSRRRLLVGGLCTALAASAVCAVLLLGQRKTVVPVSGKVIVDGQPLESGMVSFVPNKAKGNKSSVGGYGMVHAGAYAIERGVPPGWYRVVVSGNLKSGQRGRLRGFNNQDKPAAIEVVESGGAESYDLTLTSSPSRHAAKRR